MEHSLIKNWFFENKIKGKENHALKLSFYARLIFEENKKYNITGLKTLDEIADNLILKSLDPFKNFDSTQSFSFVDIGTGSGIPGIALAIFFPNFTGLLLDANKKKINFIEGVIKKLKIDNVDIKNTRIEEIAHDFFYREKFNLCVSRAFGPLYYSIELGLPMLKKNGFLYIYSHLEKKSLSEDLLLHIKKLNGKIIDNSKHKIYGISKEGLLFLKVDKNEKIFPRNFVIIKREAKKVKEIKD